MLLTEVLSEVCGMLSHTNHHVRLQQVYQLPVPLHIALQQHPARNHLLSPLASVGSDDEEEDHNDMQQVDSSSSNDNVTQVQIS